ncbi:MAG TPA: methyltransferase domain-containing protein [Syntrophorhabdaceae bacterium]|nr:methyltransferase domain-containing protein [Syntrophorhabdaceae bacterium]
MQKEEIKKIYSRYSPVYDVIFSRAFSPRIKCGLEKIGIKNGQRILEVGVGTGLSLSLYPNSCNVVGIDITRKMLEKAQQKKEKMGLTHVDLIEMDAENLTFEDDSFDHAVIPFVISVVPSPERMMAEVKRVTKTNGKIIIVNHFSSGNAFFFTIEKMLAPLFIRLGWKSGLTLDLLSNHCNLCIEEVTRKHSLDLWWVVHVTNKKDT